MLRTSGISGTITRPRKRTAKTFESKEKNVFSLNEPEQIAFFE